MPTNLLLLTTNNRIAICVNTMYSTMTNYVFFLSRHRTIS